MEQLQKLHSIVHDFRFRGDEDREGMSVGGLAGVEMRVVDGDVLLPENEDPECGFLVEEFRDLLEVFDVEL